MTSASTFKGTVDVGIITIKEEEMRAVLDRFPNETQVVCGQRDYNVIDFKTDADSSCRIAVLRCTEQGNGEAQEATRDLLEDLSPRWILVVGIAGGAPSEDFTLGDVIVSDRIHDLSLEAASAKGDREFSISGGPLNRAALRIISNLPVIEKKIEGWNLPSAIRQTPPVINPNKLSLYGDKDWKAKVRNAVAPLSGKSPRIPQVKAGAIASSDRLVKDTELVRVWRKVARNIHAIEMESAGVYRAARERVPMFAIRGVSDIVGLKRSPEWTNYACQTAAAFMHALLRAGCIPPSTQLEKGVAGIPAKAAADTQDSRQPRLAINKAMPRYAADSIQAHIATALLSIETVGDTDIFPFPLEHHVFHDKTEDVLSLLTKVHERFDEHLRAHPPAHESTLSQLGYTAYRWATQLDPFWNAYYLALVISIGREIEARRISKDARTVFSYRFQDKERNGRIFDESIGWSAFQERSLELARNHGWVVKCDIADFYARISHERLVFALRDCSSNQDAIERIRKFLANNKGHAHGLPVGGPASRLLSEVLLNRVDHLLNDSGIVFCRFSDDYHLFAPDRETAYTNLIRLAEVLQVEEGLTLQKLKTRIMQSSEFLKLSETHGPPDAPADSDARAFLAVRLRYDPYSPTAEEDYERLRSEVARFDILGMLGREMSKSRVHESLTRQLVRAIRYLEKSDLSNAVRTLMDNHGVLAPVFSVVLVVVGDVFDMLDDPTRVHVCATLCRLLSQNSALMRIDIHASYAIRILARMQSHEHQSLLVKMFELRKSPLLGRDIILIMAHWKATHFLSSLKRKFMHLHPWVRRAYITASHTMGNEGDSWRVEASHAFDQFESLTNNWAQERAASGKIGLLL
ncbi:hypothetical protein JQX13_48735 [Archangium violaceum]|uniref:phosphorylase family protein n=1 Tax=Archangium violaceum TaxID=83451 RepID=UPI00193AFA24|nr:reverse transcriptase domain-containing protein [Archangium violaceum]QRK07787.1 hypothetical protein JQX13_48735 [Archangium violaceum]